MPKTDSAVLMPVLSAGRHRSPRQGACFMEFASWLAGERWSDHPSCTNPALASLARLVNDCTSHRGRERLVELVPSVIGLVDDDPLIAVLVAVRAAGAAITVAATARMIGVKRVADTGIALSLCLLFLAPSVAARADPRKRVQFPSCGTSSFMRYLF